jgi:hypothetical protein
MTKRMDPFSRWMVKKNIDLAASDGAATVVARLRHFGYVGVADAVELACRIDAVPEDFKFSYFGPIDRPNWREIHDAARLTAYRQASVNA